MEQNNRYPWRDKDLMERLYNEERMSHAEIADKFGCAQSTITVWMGKHDIDPRPTSVATAMAKGPLSINVNRDGYEVFQTRIDWTCYTILHHRLLGVAEYGFDAVSGNVVHHKNGVKWDNRPSNIELKSDSEHKKEHAIQFWQRDDYRQAQERIAQNAERDENGRFA